MTSQHDNAKRWQLNPRPVIGMKMMQYGVCMILVGVVHVFGWLPTWLIDRSAAQSAVFFGLGGLIIIFGFLVRRKRDK